MGTEGEFDYVRRIDEGCISFVYQVDQSIVVKISNKEDCSNEQFRHEVEMYKKLSKEKVCAFIVQCFHFADDGIFLENIRGNAPEIEEPEGNPLIKRTGGCLAMRINDNHIWNHKTGVVTEVKKLEPLHLRLAWMNDITQAIAFLESVNIAHGDIRPENVLFDGDRAKLTDFDNAEVYGTPHYGPQPPWGRELSEGEPNYGIDGGTGGLMGPRTEQFGLGSMYYYINYGLEPHGDQKLTDTPRNRGVVLNELLKAMQLPDLKGEPMIDKLIDQCWHNHFPTIAELSVAIKELPRSLGLATEECEPNNVSSIHSDSDVAANIAAKKAFCEDLEKRGLLSFLNSEMPPYRYGANDVNPV